jgi:hypothetical protein
MSTGRTIKIANPNSDRPMPSAVSMAQPDNGRLAATILLTPTVALSTLVSKL